jgi:pilus assembly protein CpaB
MMNRTRLLMIGGMALALGLVASGYVYKNLQRVSGGGAEQQAAVMVAANDLQVGAKVGQTDIKVIHVPVSAFPAGAPQRYVDVVGHGVITPISKGDFILNNKLAGENVTGLPSLITPGMRAVSVRVNEVVSVAGFVTPGTRVDVLLTGTPSGGSDAQTTTVLQDVKVLASGHTLERSATGEAQNTPVITLLVTPDDAQRLTLASSEGHIQLALRNPLDTRQEQVPAASAKALYRGGAPAAPTGSAPVRHTVIKKVVEPLPASTGISVEVYQGDRKMDVVKFPDESSETK